MRENELQRRIGRVLMKWCRYALEQYEDWPNRERCGHFFGGAYWYGLETSSTVMVMAVLSRLDGFDEALAGAPQKELADKAIRGLRYLCFTHDTGPADCVRATGSNRANSGRKWGGRNDPYFFATQTGGSISSLAIAALLLWDELDEETKELLRSVTVYYAERWSPVDPLAGVYADTQCEENAWTALGISTAAYLFPDDPRAGKWKEAAAKWAFASINTYKDHIEHGPAAAVTFHPDWTTENHRFVHPSYMAAGILMRSKIALLALMRGEKPLAETTRYNREVYEETLLPWSQADGQSVPVQGQSWWYNRQHEAFYLHMVMDKLCGHPLAAARAEDALSFIERIQASNGRGCMLEENGEELVVVAKDDQSAKDMEHGAAGITAAAYLLTVYAGAGSSAASASEAKTAVRPWTGVKLYPYGSTAVYGTGDAFSAFSWRNHVMAMTLPARGMWDVTPDYASYTGTVTAAPAERPGEVAEEQAVIEARQSKIVPYARGFGAVAALDRADGLLRQDVAFAALPDGCSVYVERMRAAKDCAVLEAHTGLIGVRNEKYEALGDWAPGRKTIRYEGGARTYEGYYGRTPDVVEDLGRPGWVNIDGRIGYVLFGTAGVRYINRHVYPKWRGIEDTLVLNRRSGLTLAAGEELPVFAAYTLPNRGEAATSDAAKACAMWDSGDSGVVLLATQNELVYVNFRDNDVLAEGAVPLARKSVPLFEGATTVRADGAVWRGRLPLGQCGYLPRLGEIAWEEAADGMRLAAVAAGGEVLFANSGTVPLAFEFRTRDGGAAQTYRLAPGQSAVRTLE